MSFFDDSDMPDMPGMGPSDIPEPFGDPDNMPHIIPDSDENNDENESMGKPHHTKVNYLKELKNMVGLNSVYGQVKQFIADAKYIRRAHQLGHKVPKTSMNMVFEGNPGTGKTMIARLIGKILYQEGFCKNRTFNEIDSSRISDGLVGQSKKNIRKWVRKSFGGVLFIDEAYELAPDNGQHNGYNSDKAGIISTLIKLIDDNRGKLVVIMAGYTKPMENFLNNTNPGLQSRFSHKIIFPDYTNKQLCAIFHYHAKREYHFEASKSTQQLVNKDINKFVDWDRKNISQDKYNSKPFGNGRVMRNLVEFIRSARNYRNEDKMNKLSWDQMNKVTPADVKAGFKSAYANDTDYAQLEDKKAREKKLDQEA